MKDLTSRGRRWPVIVDAEVRTGGPWLPARVRNVSARGLLIASGHGIPRGTYIEVRAKGLHAVGRVVWTRGRYSGVRASDPIDLVPMLGAAGGADTGAARKPAAATARAATVASATRTAARIRAAALALALVVAAGWLGHGVDHLFAEPLGAVQAALGGR